MRSTLLLGLLLLGCVEPTSPEPPADAPLDAGAEAGAPDQGQRLDQEIECQPIEGRACGDDGCGGALPPCVAPAICEIDPQTHRSACVASSTPCGDGRCAPEEDCGACPEDCGCGAGARCQEGICACDPQCDGLSCGADQCGGHCGACGPGLVCINGACACIPDCASRDCGPDGCLGICGLCEDEAVCSVEGRCQAVPETCGDLVCDPGEDCAICPEDCAPCCGDRRCGRDEGCDLCPEDCGCDVGSSCEAGVCVCVPECEGRACGDDGCGGSCGACPDGESCAALGDCAPVVVGHCGDGTCDEGEGCDACLEDCGCAAPLVCVEERCACSPSCTLLVESFGARPDDGVDDGPALRAAIAEARALSGPVELRFEAGVYRVGSEGGRHLHIGDAHGLTLRGAGPGTVLLMTDPSAHGLYLQDSAEITLSDLAIDYDPPPFTQGTVVAANFEAGVFELALDEGYPRFEHPMFDASAPNGTWGIVVDGRRSYELRPIYGEGLPSSWPEVRPGVFRIIVDGGGEAMEAGRLTQGARYVSLARGGGVYANALNFWRVQGLNLSAVTVHASPGLAVLLAQAEEVSIQGYRVAFPEQGDRLLTTDADGIHAFGVRGGFEISESHFEGMADDSINIHARAALIREARSPQEVLISHGGTTAPRVGEALAVYDPDTGDYRGQARAVEVTPEGDYFYRVRFDQGILGVIGDAQAPQGSDWLFNLDACGRGARIHHNTFGRHRGRAMVLRSIEVEVYENTIENVDGLGVAILLNSAWMEGPIPADILVRDNDFIGVSRDENPMGHPAISTAIVARGGGYAEGMGIRDITIQNNTFEGLKGQTMHVSNTTGFNVLGNWTNNTRQNKAVSSASILFRPGVSADIRAYAVTDQSPETYAGVHIQAGAAVTYEDLNMALSPGTPWVRDDN